ncbi:DNA-binding RFX2-like isoform X5 [Brachionus plicatilis]|uniref:DNA-binding RFX2-like isoform X5 n=1 Tax=Brachionus plicatilis TaxID=10195 RepID=A0A3M7PPB4_BRAPC|nr:DNA-binding RFX2-like isoform X5 [Brachionus plicatilis]
MTVVLSSANKNQTAHRANKTEHNNNNNNNNNKAYVSYPEPHEQQPLVKQAHSDQDLNQLSLAETNPYRNFGHISTDGLEGGAVAGHELLRFEDLYKKQCERIVDAITSLKFESIRDIWLGFWRAALPSAAVHTDYESQMSSHKFYSLCELPQVVDYVKHADHEFYQFCIEILIPDVLGSLPHNLVQNIRALSKNVDSWLRQALCNCPERMRQVKLAIINTFSMTLRRYTSLNHLAQTVKNSLQNETILGQMLNDINRVDFNYIREQAKWICGCDERLVTRLEAEFKASLRNHGQWSLDAWIGWLDSTATSALLEHEGTHNYAKMARQFLLKWTFMCSSIVRDLTLRSAPTFGSFHLIRLLYDEYMCYLIEIKIAGQLKQSPLATMCNSDC